jgi:type IV pilus assembly protein PilB
MSNDDEKHSTQNVAPPVGARHVSWPTIRTQSDLSKTAELYRSGGHVYVLQGKKIGEILNSLGVIDDKTLQAVEQHHNTKKSNSKPIGQLLVHMGIIETEVLTRALCIQSGVPMVDLLAINIPYDILGRIPNEKAVEKKVVPVGVYNKTLFLAVADPATFSDQHHFAFITKLNIKPVFSPSHEIDTFINTKWTGAGSDFWAG